MIEFAGHHFTEESVSANWPPTKPRVNEVFSALGRSMSVYTPILESVQTASDSVSHCAGTVYLLKVLHEGLQEGGTISGTLGSAECCRKLAFSYTDRRIHLISIGEDCGVPDMTLQLAARLPQVIAAVQESALHTHAVSIDEEHAFLLLSLGLYFSAGVPSVPTFEKIVPYFSEQGTIRASIGSVINLLKQGLTVSQSLERSQLLPPQITSHISKGESRGELETTLTQLANLSVWPV